MSTRDRNTAPGFGTVLRAQLRMLLLLQRRDLLILAGIMAGLVALSYWGQLNVEINEGRQGPDAIPIFSAVSLPLLLIGALWPLGVWRYEDPSRRGYFWSMPVAQGPHTLSRVLAGWILLLGVTLAVAIVAVITVLPTFARFEGTGVSFRELWVPFVVPLIPYLLVSALMIAFEHPLRLVAWCGAALLGVAIVSQIGDGGIAARLFSAVGKTVSSLGVATLAPVFAPMGGVRLDGVWSLHYPGWLAGGLALCALAAFRRRDVA